MSETVTPEREAVRERVLARARSGDVEGLRELLGDVHPSDIADLLEGLDEIELRLLVVRALPVSVAAEAVSEMEEGEGRAELLGSLDPGIAADLLHAAADDDAADLLGELDARDRSRILSTLPIEEAGDLQGLLLYDEETAGGLMTTAVVALESTLSAADAIQEVRRRGREVEGFYTILVVDHANKLLGTVPLDHLILADPGTPVSELVEPTVASVTPEVDQEEVGRLLSRYNLVSLPVVNDFGQLLGRITFDDVIDVIEAEQTEDILRLAGLPEEEELRAGWAGAVRSRLPWLLLNLVTAFAASMVPYIFSETIENAVILAAIMPIIAGMGGNAGTQALAVTVRGLALSGGPLERRFDAVGKEMLVGLVNGAALGLIVALVAAPVGGDPILGLVVLLSMWGNIIVAGFAGSWIPTLLDRIGVDPAVASSIFVTTLTDLVGFFLLLGLASALLL